MPVWLAMRTGLHIKSVLATESLTLYDQRVLTGFHHVTLNVTDLPRARAFSEGILDFLVVQDFPGRKLSLRVGTSRSRLVLRPTSCSVDADRFSEYRIGLDHVASACLPLLTVLPSQ